ncbi:MAG: hypothetical protein GXY61_07020 [Lentisphaerae bacterium]|nr:hypothetical protein [Lentisphaerota bacterium]
MRRIVFYSAVIAAAATLVSAASEDEIREAVQQQGEPALLEHLTALERAAFEAKNESDFSMELRPSLNDDDDVSVALRINLPSRWSNKRLQTQLALVSTAEQLRIAQLEWEEIIVVYREFCTYRMLDKKSVLLEQELDFMKPYLELADERVERRQFLVSDRMRLYSDYLALLNDLGKLQNERVEIEKTLKIVLGPDAEIETLAEHAVIPIPTEMELDALVKTATKQRVDYQLLEVEIEQMKLAEEAARREGGFQLKYIQPSYRVDSGNGREGWEISTALVLPWGRKNPDIALYRQYQAVSLASQSLQRQMIEDRLRVLFDIVAEYRALSAEQTERTTPVLDQLNADIVEEMEKITLDQVRNLLSIRKQILDASLQVIEKDGRLESLAVDFAQELGGW